jgi:hypothetical protein
MNRRLGLILGVPLLGGALVFAAISSRRASEPEHATRKSFPAPLHLEGPIQAAPPPRPDPKPAPEKSISVAMDEARLRTTYQNYRTALATGNRVQADALYPVLVRDRKAALQLAQQDLAQARQDFDRSVAEKAVDALRR